MLKNVFKRFLSLTMAIAMVISMLPAVALPTFAASGSLTMTDEGLIVSYSGDGTVSGGDTSITASVAGTDKSGCTAASAKTATITFTNEKASGKAATLTFDYSITANNGSVVIGSDTLTGSGSYSTLIECSLNTKMVLTSGAGSSLNTAINLTNVHLTEVSAIEVTFKAPENGTYTVGGEAIAADTVKEAEPPVTFEVAATAASGYKFVGWYSDAEAAYVSFAAAASLTVKAATTIYPVFVSGSAPVFQVDDQVYLDLNEANTAAAASSSKLIILAEGGTLAAGDYTISSGVKFLIPYNTNNTADFDEAPGLVNARKEGVYAKPTPFRTLTLASGATIRCSGQINVNAQMYVETNVYTSQVTGPYGAIDLTAGSKLSMESGSTLYCYGYIGGSGTVEGKSGSKIYQMMQINDWRGGSATSDLSGQLKGNSFLFSQYYLQNVEANLKVNSGSTMYAVTGLTAGSGVLNQAKQVAAPIIGTSAGLFRMDSSRTGDYITLKYDSATDRMDLDLYGNINTVAIEMKVNLGIGMNFSLNTDEYILPIPANFTIDIHDGSAVSFTEKFKLLPGTEINVEKGATVTIGSNGAVYLYDADDWNSGKYAHNGTIYPLRYVHATKGAPAVARKVTKDAVLKVNGTLNAQGPVYSTKYHENGGDAGITGTGTVQVGVHGTTNLLESNNNATDALVTVTCVPVLGTLAGSDESRSFDKGLYHVKDGYWYQYTLTGEGYTVCPGDPNNGGSSYVYVAEDGSAYIANCANEPAKVWITATAECLPVVGATVTKAVSAARSVGDTYLLSGTASVDEQNVVSYGPITGNIQVTAYDTHQEVVDEKKDPTCLEPGLTEGIRCERCIDILAVQAEIPATGHTEEVLPAKAPTCTETGLTEGKHCASCGHIFVEQTVIEATGHSYNDGVIDPAPTCEGKGVKTFTCATCGDTYTEEIAAAGHTEEVIPAKDPTCTEGGLTAGKKCSVCGKILEEQQVIEALDHSYESEVTTPATCSTYSVTTHTCTVCGYSYQQTGTEYDPSNHANVVKDSAKAPTCTDTGLTEGSHCAGCNTVITKQETLDALGHTEEILPAVDPTCTATGLTAGKKCSTCGETLVPQEIIAAKSHDYEVTVTGEPTCNEEGQKTYTCKVCGYSYVEAVSATGHTEEAIPGKAATCTEGGKTEGKKCSVCGEILVAQEDIAALGHDYSDVKVTPPTCTAQGYTTHKCIRCSEFYVDSYTSVESDNHNYDSTRVIAPTCTGEGYTVNVCAICAHEERVAGSEVAALGHKNTSVVTAPTCTEGGFTTDTCSVCGNVSVHSEVEAKGHTEEVIPAVAATCTDTGLTEGKKCSVCGDMLVQQTKTSALGHNYTSVVTAPTCTKKGFTTHTCARCSDSYVDTYTEMVPHSWNDGEITTEPTCAALGVKTFTCTVCGATRTEDVEMLEHVFGEWEEVTPSTCQVRGEQKRACTGCGTEETAQLDYAPHNHNKVEVTEPTCTENGKKEYFCDVEGCTYQAVDMTEEIAALGHAWGDGVVTKPATCTVPGVTTFTCERCGETKEEPVGVLGHDYVFVSKTEADCTTGVVETSQCSRCGDVSKVEVTAPLGHEEVITEGKEPTCTEEGMTRGVTCSVCNGVIEVPQVIPATGHDEGVAVEAKAATCMEAGREAGLLCPKCEAFIEGGAEIAALGHDFGEWTVKKLPSCSEEGEDIRVCQRAGCALEESRPVEKTEHTVEVDEAVPARYDKTGLTEGSHCSVCDEVIVAQEEVPKLVLDWNGFKEGLQALEYYANEYAKKNPGKDPMKLMINFLRTGVDRYNDDEWETMAGAPEEAFIKDVLAYDDLNGTHAYALREMDYLDIKIPNGEMMVFDHVFGALNVSSKNNYGQNNTDFGSWVGDLCDLMEVTYEKETGYSEDNYTVEALVALINEKYFGVDDENVHGFGMDDVMADLDAYYIVSKITAGETSLYKIFTEYYDSGLNAKERAAYFLNNRFPGSMTQEAVRSAIFTTYDDNFLADLLESGRGLSELHKLREAACYVFADYLYAQAEGKLVEPEDPDEDEEDEDVIDVYKVFESKESTLAPGVTQSVNYAVNAKGEQIVFFTATADINRSDVSIYANYANNDPSKGWAMAPVSAQMAAAAANHADEKDYTPVVGVNGSFYNMSTGEPSGLLIMNGTTYKGMGSTFFGVLADGTPIIGDKAVYEANKEQLVEAVEGGVILVKDGVSLYPNEDNNRNPRTAVGITKDGKIVVMVLDGRQSPYSAGASYHEIAKIMVDLGCVSALNLDGGGSSTFVAKQEGADNLSLVNRPCDTVERSVSSSLMIVSTAPTSKEFHHAVVNTPTDYITIGSSFDAELIGVGEAGNTAEIPEGAYLRVSDETKGSISGNTFTALAVGKVEIQLVVNDAVVGTKTVTIIKQPTALKFTENNINATYGVAEKLPLVATYNSSNVTIHAGDIVFEMSNASAGTMDGFLFTGKESSKVRNVTITAKLALDTSVTASMSLRLYGADESIFDFAGADSGNESLAWNRNVVNTITVDKKNYYTKDPAKEVYADYTFAIDMKAITAPVRLLPLMDYLNGFAEGVGDNATPWDYMLALGGRVSDLTTITIMATFPAGVTVDMSDVAFVNDYLNITSIDYNETTRTMAIVCNWIRQTAGIDASTANSIAILSGVKLIPDESSDKVQIDVVGNVKYDIYLDTSQLHSFASDPANQEKYGLMPYVNPNDPEDAGGHFADTYINFEDHFAVYGTALNGWVTGGVDNDLHYYYVDNQMVTGVYLATDMEGSANSYYYDFGEDGIAVGKYTGLFLDPIDNVYRYAQVGVLKSGWVMIEEDWHYFATSDYNAYTGNRKVGGVYFDFDETGRVTKGVWAKDMGGTKYYYGPSCYQKGFYTIDGKEYAFDKGYMLTGIASIRTDKTQPYRYYDFGPNGTPAKVLNGIHTIDGTLRYLEDGVLTEKGLFKYNGDYYFSIYQGVLRTNGEYGTYSVDGCDLPNGRYTFDENGKLVLNAIVERDGKLYYYENGRPKEKGLFKFEGDYYYAVYGGVLRTDGEYSTYSVDGCDMPNGKYLFDADGKMIVNAIIERDGKLYYYENGKPKEKGLFKFNGDYYFSGYGGVLKTSGVYGTYTVDGCDLPNGRYEFGVDGKMLQGIVEKNGKLYYYENGNPKEMGLFKYNGDYYFAVYKGELRTNGVYGTYKVAEVDLPNGSYEFGPDGKMTQGIVEKDGKLYYYEGGRGVEKGLFKFNGDYYFSVYKGELRTNGVYGVYILEDCGLPKGNYEFGADGKMLQGIVEKDGKLYYYENGKGVEKGLFKYNGAYYFAAYRGELKTNGSYSAYNLGACDLPNGRYEFDAEGKMLQGIVEKDGKLYFYENGKAMEKGLFKYNGHYYFSVYKGELQTNGVYSAYNLGACDLPNGRYEFDAEGKMLQGIVEKDGKLYFYENGKATEKGLFYYEGYYYYSVYKGELVTGRRFNVTQGNGLLIEKFYTFNEKGQIIA